MSLSILLTSISIIGLAIALRIIPLLLAPQGAGVDHWFWRKYIETYRTNKQFPPVMPQYLLDQHQWYPPLFPLLMMLLPSRIFNQWNTVLAIIVDMVRLLLLLLIASWLTNENQMVICLAGLIYATTPIQISYNFQLNPRGLAALFLDCALILLLWFYSYHGPSWVWLLVVFLSGLILLTHKMTAQLFWFLCLCCSILFQDIRLFLLIPASITMAMIISKGFYLKVMRAHLDIVKFWHQHWRWIGADAVRESPIYGEGQYERRAKLHQSGLRGIVWYCFLLFGFNPASWIACLLLFERLFTAPHVLIYSSWLMVWLLVPCLLAILTTFVPKLRCIGAGYLYLYNTSLITSLLLALMYAYTLLPLFSTVIYLSALGFNIVGVMLFYRKFYRNNRARIDHGFNNIIEILKQLPVGTVWCLPSGWHEPVAYKTKHAVLWGAHGYGFKLLTPTFPRLLLPLSEIIKKYQITYLLTHVGQLTEQCENELTPKQILRKDDYILYIF